MLTAKHSSKLPLLLFSLYMVICLTGLYVISLFTYLDLINNGYVDEKAITFDVHNEENIEFIFDLENTIILQHHPSYMQKRVWVLGNIKLPPINVENVGISHSHEQIILGKNYNGAKPPKSKVFGYFNTPNSEELNSSLWILKNTNRIDWEQGNRFSIHSPNPVTRKNLETMLRSYSGINVIEETTLSNLNTVSTYIIYATILLFTWFIMVMELIYLFKQKALMSILYLSGIRPKIIATYLLKQRVLGYALLSAFLFLIGMLLNRMEMFSLWDNKWLTHFAYLIFSLLSLLTISTLLSVYRYTTFRGGKKG
ncbi:hypothetical protein J26TS2_40630 [Shouchella clausii]|nr:hypothetical protein J26TS2_40630 [Shouchella clausii]